MQARNVSKETAFNPISGCPRVAVALALFASVILSIVWGVHVHEPQSAFIAVALLLMLVLCLPGFFVVEPNLGRVIVLFGRYRGSVRTPGFYWTNPFTAKKKISLRVHNLNGKALKVNDLLGNPIEIAAIVVWQVSDSAQATFDIVEFEKFVDVQSEAAVRYVASRHPYDTGHTDEVSTTLRGSADVVAHELQGE